MTLLEKAAELGGHFLVASHPPGKGEISGAIRSFIVNCREAGVDIQMCIRDRCRTSSTMRSPIIPPPRSYMAVPTAPSPTSVSYTHLDVYKRQA